MKIFFIYPNSGSQVGFNYGVAHMAGVLKQAGHQVVFWQLCEDLAPLPSREEFLARIQEESPDVLAFSVVTNQWEYTKQLAQWVRTQFTGPLVCGGVHSLVCGQEILETGLFDYVFKGECEDAFLEFVDKLQRGEAVEEVRNMGYLRNGQIYWNPVRPLPDLERLPFKDYRIMDFQKLIDAKDGWVGLMASRGCPFSCTYCFNHKMVATYREDLQCSFSGLNYIRRFPVQRMIEEIQYLLENYQNIKMFIFDDDLFTFDNDYIQEFCLAYRKVCSIPFVVNAHVNFFDQSCAQALAEAGCRVVKFGVESGSEKIRKSILNRHMSNEKIVESIQLVNDSGMHSSVFIIIGFPHESQEDVIDTIRLLARARPGRFRWTYFYPYPGTQAHEIAEKGGYIDHEKMRTLQNFTDQSCLQFGPEQDLFLQKVGRIMPWFVNAYSDLSVAKFYRQKVEDLLQMEQSQWRQISETLPQEDKSISARFAGQGLTHYAIKYNRFMGVISDYFLHEE